MNGVKYWEINFAYSMQMCSLIMKVLENFFKFTYICVSEFFITNVINY